MDSFPVMAVLSTKDEGEPQFGMASYHIIKRFIPLIILKEKRFAQMIVSSTRGVLCKNFAWDASIEVPGDV